MNDFYLKAASQESLFSAFGEADLLSESGNPRVVATDFALDIIGTIYEPTDETFTEEETGEEYPSCRPWRDTTRISGPRPYQSRSSNSQYKHLPLR
ncbi:hypothetical protein [uncultured Alcanivorax sp.]|uniref:hypothetical protein n=1 Tax=uncultured Alcanivorax sp. TaxID=191215 RepID=UPI0032B27FEB